MTSEIAAHASLSWLVLAGALLLSHGPALAAEHGIPGLNAKSLMKVWAIGEGVRIDPLTGNAFEEDSKQLPGGITGDYRSRNLVWDGATKTINLRGARNEMLSFQLILEGEGVKGINVAASDLKGPRDALIPAGNTTFFRAFYVHVRQKSGNHAPLRLATGWYPDPLVPLDTPKLGAPFAIDGSNFGGRNPGHVKNQTVWVDLWIPKKSPKGTYRGRVTVTSDAGATDLNLNVQVHGFQMPARGNTVFEFESYNYLAKEISRKCRDSIYALGQEHRTTITSVRSQETPGVDLTPKDGRFDWSGFDKVYGPAIDGRLVKNGPRAGVPAPIFNFAFEPRLSRPDKGRAMGKDWPLVTPLKNNNTEVDFTADYVKQFKALLKDTSAHFAKKYPHTTVVIFQVALDEPAFHKEDESLAMAHARSIKGYLEILKELDLKNVRYKLDIGAGYSGCRFDLDGDGRREGPKDVVGALGSTLPIIWDVNGKRMVLDPLRPVQKKGSQVWFYNGYEPRVGSTVIGGEAVGPRTWAWVNWNSETQGMTVWACLYGAEERPWTTAGTGEPGNALHIYPGHDVGMPDKAFASIRLKAFRRSMQDYEYFHMLAERDGNRNRANALCRSVVKHNIDGVAWPKGKPHWSHDPEAFDKVRYQIGAILEK